MFIQVIVDGVHAHGGRAIWVRGPWQMMKSTLDIVGVKCSGGNLWSMGP